jgi:peptide/nickel transport system substrate-binding protein
VKQSSLKPKIWLANALTLLKRSVSGFLFIFKKVFSGWQKNPTVIGNQHEFDKKLVYSLSKSRIPNWQQLKYLKKFLNPRELILIRASFAVLIISLIFLTGSLYLAHRVLSPTAGGEYSEGVVGTAKYINPLYSSLNDVDADLGRLVFSSLLKRGPDGRLMNDLAEGYGVSEDGKSYTFKLKQNVKWHDGSDLTAQDAVFTFNAIKDADYRSPLRSAFIGDDVEQLDDYSLKFSLREAYAAFPELLTFGILPAAAWQNVPAGAASLAELNLKPIGSGPYKFKSFVKDDKGNLKYYNFEPWENYYGEQAKISKLQIRFFPNSEEAVAALADNQIDGYGNLSLDDESRIPGKSYFNFTKVSIPQITAVFFNQKANPQLADINVRQALAKAVNKDELAGSTLGGRAMTIDGPLLPSNFAYYPGVKKYGFNQAEAAASLENAGWKIVDITKEALAQAGADKDSKDAKTKASAERTLAMGEGRFRMKDGKYLTIKLTTIDAGDDPKVAAAIKTYWESGLNIKVAVELIPISDIQAKIKSREYEALLYGEVLTADPDVYAYWHASKVGEGGLNLANYSSNTVNKALEDGRLTSNREERIKQYQIFQQAIAEDLPAIFLYSPYYVYVQAKKINGFDGKMIIDPSDRFSNINSWYIKTEKRLVW